VADTHASTDGTIALLNDVAEFLEGQADVRDGSDGPRPNKAMELMARAEIEIERLKRASLRGPNDEAVKLLRRCHDAGDLVTPLDETLWEDVEAFFFGSSRATPQGMTEDERIAGHHAYNAGLDKS
jgi:hypothetical protein